MLHTLNKAWATILINQLLDNKKQTIMFVAKDEAEADYYADMFRDNVKILKKGNPNRDSLDGILWTETRKDKVNHEVQTLCVDYERRFSEQFRLQVFVITEKGINSGAWKTAFETLEQMDDILISHDIHDVMLKDYLARHCKRKCC